MMYVHAYLHVHVSGYSLGVQDTQTSFESCTNHYECIIIYIHSSIMCGILINLLRMASATLWAFSTALGPTTVHTAMHLNPSPYVALTYT